MAFTHLPNEILEEIIIDSLPEGFESLALTCKEIFALCCPFIGHHNKLRAHFREFWYGYRPRMYNKMLVTRPYPLMSACMLIAQIAVEPVVARYIQHGDFHEDSQFSRYTEKSTRRLQEHPHFEESVIRLLADSPYLKEAGLDWKEYYATMKEDFLEHRYSQYAAVFLLTLLPNVNRTRLPWWWKSLETTDKLLDVISRRARQATLLHDRPSMAQVKMFTVHSYFAGATAFLNLPQLRYFKCCNSIKDHRDSSSTYQYGGTFENIEVVNLSHVAKDEESLVAFLQQTPCLKSLHYSHSTEQHFVRQDWDFCKLIAAMERQVGTHIVKLCLSIHTFHGNIVRGQTSMCGFQRLEKLEFPLEIAMSNLSISAPAEGELYYPEFFVRDLVPASVSGLSLLSDGKDRHEKALDAMFHDFATRKTSEFPALQEIHLSCLEDADNAYKQQCHKLVIEAGDAGVLVYLRNDLLPLQEWSLEDYPEELQ
jgi:hypothetical protein